MAYYSIEFNNKIYWKFLPFVTNKYTPPNINKSTITPTIQITTIVQTGNEWWPDEEEDEDVELGEGEVFEVGDEVGPELEVGGGIVVDIDKIQYQIFHLKIMRKINK